MVLTTSPAGYSWSELQSVGSVTNTNLGFGAIFNNAATTNLRIADDFTVTSTMNVTAIDFFCYQTGYASEQHFRLIRCAFKFGMETLL